MTRHTLRPGTACVHLVRANVVEFTRPDLPPLDGDELIIELRQEIEALEWALTVSAWVGLGLLAAGLLGWSLWLCGACR